MRRTMMGWVSKKVKRPLGEGEDVATWNSKYTWSGGKF